MAFLPRRPPTPAPQMNWIFSLECKLSQLLRKVISSMQYAMAWKKKKSLFLFVQEFYFLEVIQKERSRLQLRLLALMQELEAACCSCSGLETQNGIQKTSCGRPRTEWNNM